MSPLQISETKKPTPLSGTGVQVKLVYLGSNSRKPLEGYGGESGKGTHTGSKMSCFPCGQLGLSPLGDPRNLSQLSHWRLKEGCSGAVLPSTSNRPQPPLQPGTVVQLGSLWSVFMEAVRAEGTWTEHASRATPPHFIRGGTKVQDNGGTGRAVSTLASQCCPSMYLAPPTSTTACWGPLLDCRLPRSVRTLRTLLC